MEPTEAVERLMVTLRVCGAFKSVYFDYKSRATTEVPANPWRIQVILLPPPTHTLDRGSPTLNPTRSLTQPDPNPGALLGGVPRTHLHHQPSPAFL